jgi:hypothetical protein
MAGKCDILNPAASGGIKDTFALVLNMNLSLYLLVSANLLNYYMQ